MDVYCLESNVMKAGVAVKSSRQIVSQVCGMVLGDKIRQLVTLKVGVGGFF